MEQERRYYRPRRYRLLNGKDWFSDETNGIAEGEEETGGCWLLPEPETLKKEEKDA